MESIVSFTIKKLDDFLTREYRLLHGVGDDVERIQNELKFMKAYLRDAETKEEGGDERVRTWILEIREIAYATEDVIDSFTLQVVGGGTSTIGALKAFSKKSLCISGQADLYDVGKDIKALRLRVDDLSRKREAYGINNIGTSQEGTSGGIPSRIIVTSSADEEHVVGFEDTLESLEAKLLHSDPKRSVVSILGMGGLGKTTIARKLFHMNKDKFHMYAWICASQKWEIKGLLRRIIKSVKYLNKDELEDLEKKEEDEMIAYVRDILEGVRYLLVIDDMWDEQVWTILEKALPENENGSRIIATTRLKDVANLSDRRTYVHELRYLRSDESWELFCKKSFPEEGGACPEDLQKLGKQMVEKCGGLPLAIIVLGGLLSKKHFAEWNDVKECIWRELINQIIKVSYLLELSYKDLPRDLQSCFLYLGLFPEDFVIDARKLIRLWVAENIISRESEFDLEESAERYLKELSRRCLIQVVEFKIRTISTFRVHDLLRDLAIDKASQLNFFNIHNEDINSDSISSARRIAIHSKHEAYTSLDQANKKVRTLAFLYNKSNQDIFMNDIGVKTLITSIRRFKLLKILELKGAGIAMKEAKMWLSEVCETLILLKYLGLEDTYIDELPKSISKLQSLQTLYVDNSSKDKPPTILPTEICKLKQLRHLIGYLTIRRSSKKKGQTVISPSSFGDLTNLQSLRSLAIHEWVTGKGDNAFEAFATLQNLKILAVRYSSADNLSITPLFNCRNLIDLEIYGKIETLPNVMCEHLSNLKYLSLEKSGLKEDPMPTLELLPKLLVLRIAAFNVSIMTVTKTGFPQLEELEFCLPRGVTTMQIHKFAMPKLKLLGLDSVTKYCFPERFKKIARK